MGVEGAQRLRVGAPFADEAADEHASVPRSFSGPDTSAQPPSATGRGSWPRPIRVEIQTEESQSCRQ